jgi:RNA-directed DNA polymerase
MIARLKRAISDQTSRNWYWTDIEDEVARLNRILLGWSNDFCLGTARTVYRAVDSHARHRLRQWLQGTHKSQRRAESGVPVRYLHDVLALDCLFTRLHSLLWANA